MQTEHCWKDWTSWRVCWFNPALKHSSSNFLPYLGAGMRACAAKRKSSMMKEQTRLELNISSLIWENWTKRKKKLSAVTATSDQPPALFLHNLWLTFSSMWPSLKTRVRAVMCSLCMRSLLRTSIARLMRLLISLEVDCQMLVSEPFVNEAKIWIFLGGKTKMLLSSNDFPQFFCLHFFLDSSQIIFHPTLFMSMALPKGISGLQVRFVFWTLGGSSSRSASFSSS